MTSSSREDAHRDSWNAALGWAFTALALIPTLAYFMVASLTPGVLGPSVGADFPCSLGLVLGRAPSERERRSRLRPLQLDTFANYNAPDDRIGGPNGIADALADHPLIGLRASAKF